MFYLQISLRNPVRLVVKLLNYVISVNIPTNKKMLKALLMLDVTAVVL